MKTIDPRNHRIELTNTESRTIVGYAPKRRYLIIQNRSTTDNLYIQFGEDATVDTGLLVSPLGSYETTLECMCAIHGITLDGDIHAIVITDQI